LIIQMIFGEGYKLYEALHFAVFSNFLSIQPS
jgi:hypothetical protein